MDWRHDFMGGPGAAGRITVPAAHARPSADFFPGSKWLAVPD